tara:strand:- start:371 stop:592 length:222 start_codon:yes stop_codon:yes gene_type:complete
MGPVEFMRSMSSDPVVNRVIQKFVTRSHQGMDRYGITMEQNNAPAMDWIEHAQEELMDAILYLERLKTEMRNG